MDARKSYESRKAERAESLARHESRANRVSALRLVVAALALALVVAIAFVHLPPFAPLGLGALVVLFVVLVVVHARIYNAKERAAAALRFYERGLLRLDGRWSTFANDGARFSGEAELYADDLDVFGPASLFQRIDTTETRFGEDRLAALLSGRVRDVWPAEVRDRQQAVAELAPRLEFRERLSASGAILGADRPSPEPFLQWAEGAFAFEMAGWRVVAWAFPTLTIATYLLAPFASLPRSIALVVVALGVVVTSRVRPQVSRIADAVALREGAIARYGEMFAEIEREAFTAPLLASLREKLAGAGTGATVEMRRLGRIIGFLDARQNEVFRLFIAPIFLWDLHCVIALERWRRRALGAPRVWLTALGELEALSSFASFAFEEPRHVFPELTAAPCFEAAALAHPLIPEGKRIGNDVTLEGPGTALVVTGSNMSGKSTLLRAMGTNAVLAMAGGPVCATSMRIGPIRVATSMRIRDSLEAGVSHFYAELQKLKSVVDVARGGETVFFLLDEILHGTNSRERLIGARAIVRDLLAHGAMGAVSTHDLAIGDLEDELKGRVANVHFQEQVVGEKMTFDYALRRGVVTSSNALRLMRMVGLDVVPLE